MTSLAPLLERFFTGRLMEDRRASANTIAGYRDAFRLLVRFAASHTGKAPFALSLDDMSADLVVAFLSSLEKQRLNSVSTRNARLAAIHAFFRYLAYEEPGHAALIQRVLAIPCKKADKKSVAFLGGAEIDALLRAPDRTTSIGRRDHAILVVAIQTGVRVSELTHLRWEGVSLDRGPHIRCFGKGRKSRCTPLTSTTIKVLRSWRREADPRPEDYVFSNRRGEPLSRDAIERLIRKHVRTASVVCPTLLKKKISPHTLRHTSAMRLLEAGVDRSVIALWLGHESITTTEVYIHANMAMKEQALERAAKLSGNSRRYRPPDPLLAFLESL
jgi:site-specific recombinase XerD